ncbi:transposase [Schleiferilactobacillus harbinensis]|nr:transposase [Schleiferilactobacillus harbinensis]
MVDPKNSIALADATPEQLRTIVQNLLHENQQMQEQLAVLKRVLYGRRRESSQNLPDGQTNLFNEHVLTQEEQAAVAKASGEDEPVKKRPKKVVHRKSMDLSQLPQNTRDYTLDTEDQICPGCGKMMADIGRTAVRKEVDFVPVKLLATTVYQHTYVCTNEQCLQDHGKVITKKADVPKPVISHSMASNAVVTESILTKFIYKVPDYRQEKLWHNRGADFTRQALSGWPIKAAEEYLRPLYNLMHQELLAQDIIHADETPYRVLAIKKAKTYYWVYTSGKFAEHQIILYDHGDTRGYGEAERFLKGYTKYLQTDGYAVYPRLPDLTMFIAGRTSGGSSTKRLPVVIPDWHPLVGNTVMRCSTWNRDGVACPQLSDLRSVKNTSSRRWMPSSNGCLNWVTVTYRNPNLVAQLNTHWAMK